MLQEMKRGGIVLYAAELSGKDYTEMDFGEKRAIIIGNEGNGLTDETLRLADERVRIPMAGKVESLNAAVSAALLMYHGISGHRSKGR